MLLCSLCLFCGAPEVSLTIVFQTNVLSNIPRKLVLPAILLLMTLNHTLRRSYCQNNELIAERVFVVNIHGFSIRREIVLQCCTSTCEFYKLWSAHQKVNHRTKCLSMQLQSWPCMHSMPSMECSLISISDSAIVIDISRSAHFMATETQHHCLCYWNPSLSPFLTPDTPGEIRGGKTPFWLQLLN